MDYDDRTGLETLAITPPDGAISEVIPILDDRHEHLEQFLQEYTVVINSDLKLYYLTDCPKARVAYLSPRPQGIAHRLFGNSPPSNKRGKGDMKTQ